jgi:ribose transport system permease protein
MAEESRNPAGLTVPISSAAPSLLSRFLHSNEASVLLATISLIVLIGVLHPNFLQPSQLVDVVRQAVYVGLLASALSFLLAMREIDLSLDSTFALTLVCAALMIKAGLNPWLAGLLSLALGALLGAFNAMIIQYVRIPSLIATLATLSLFRGAVFAVSGGQQVLGMPLEHPFFAVFGGASVLGLPVSVWVMLALVVLLNGVLYHTTFGYRVRQIGSNPAAATFSGIPVARVRLQVFMLAGVLAGVAGLLALAFFTSADPNIGSGLGLSAVAAAVIGGTPLRGGTATAVGASIGAILLSAVTSGLVYFNIPANWSQFATGAVILSAVTLDSLIRNRGKKRALEEA